MPASAQQHNLHPRWDNLWGRHRDRLAEYPEDWVPPNPERLTDGRPTEQAFAVDAVLTDMGTVIATEADHRAHNAGAIPPLDFDTEIERLTEDLYDLDDRIADAWHELEEEALDDLFPGVWPENLDFEAQVALRRHAYTPDATRGPVTADLTPTLSRRARVTASLTEVIDQRAAVAQEWAAAFRDEAFGLLSECRSMGPGHSAYPFLLHQADKHPANALAAAANHLPQAWIAALNDSGPLSVLPASTGYWHANDRVAGVPGGTNKTVDDPTVAGAVHIAFTMAADHLPHLRRLQWVFVERRTTRNSKFGNVTTSERRTLLPIQQANPFDLTGRSWRNGNFASPYVGVCAETPLPEDRYEVLGVGAQGLIAGHPYLWRPHDDLIFWMLGVLSAG